MKSQEDVSPYRKHRNSNSLESPEWWVEECPVIWHGYPKCDSYTGYGEMRAMGDSDRRKDQTVSIHNPIHNLLAFVYHHNSERYTNH